MPGDADAEFAAFVHGRGPALLRTAFLLTGNHADAEDLLQTVLAKTYARWNSIKTPAAEAYVRVALARTAARSRGRHRETPVGDLPDQTAAGPAAHPAADDLWDRLARLPARQRAVLVLRYYEDLSEAQIAEVLRCRPGTVKSLASRALQALRANSQATAAEGATA